MRIETERLTLRRALPDDLLALHAILSDEQAMRYWSSLAHGDVETTRRWLDDMIAASSPSSDEFVVERAGRVIGKLGGWRLPEIGFIFAPSEWGKGYAAEALAAFVPYIFARGWRYLTADVDPRNAASLALLASAGFRETGRAARTWRIGDHWCDSIYLRLDRSTQ